MNYSDPLDILYMSAEGTFLRMLRKSAVFFGNIVQLPVQHGAMFAAGVPYPGFNRTLDMRDITNRSSIDTIQYVENETLKERFMDCKKVI